MVKDMKTEVRRTLTILGPKGKSVSSRFRIYFADNRYDHEIFLMNGRIFELKATPKTILVTPFLGPGDSPSMASRFTNSWSHVTNREIDSYFTRTALAWDLPAGRIVHIESLDDEIYGHKVIGIRIRRHANGEIQMEVDFVKKPYSL
jgi:hypothetical protein